jgi:phage terminase large subunit-like protein
LLSELASFPHGANDDQVDALAYAVRELERSAKVTSW